MKKKLTFLISLLILLSLNCYAEGQDGLNSIFNIFYFIWATLCVILLTAIGGISAIIIGRTMNQTHLDYFKIFGISFIISVLLIIILGKELVNGIWNLL
ncbi:hypothetical protein [Flavobacterium aquicola]|uniref:TrbC/VIRB2 family protein n=1 Tax=Flavobacterium aquicola TaxID=1682742 RepID=A0A3E0DXG2_9FLAO|nr:hypothetical protein [Flavobacterium aquicola]REG88560.1 hypothetical protein C8P67_1334 [Flavobacterium aquicola]